MATEIKNGQTTCVFLNRDETIKVFENQLNRKLTAYELDGLENGEIVVESGVEEALRLMLSQLGIMIIRIEGPKENPSNN